MSRAVLVVEGYPDLRRAIVETLTRLEIACEVASNSDDAIAMLRVRQYETILLGGRLPIKDDPVMQFLHDAQPDELKKVIVMAEPEIGEDDAGVLLKPFNADQLWAKLRL